MISLQNLVTSEFSSLTYITLTELPRTLKLRKASLTESHTFCHMNIEHDATVTLSANFPGVLYNCIRAKESAVYATRP